MQLDLFVEKGSDHIELIMVIKIEMMLAWCH